MKKISSYDINSLAHSASTAIAAGNRLLWKTILDRLITWQNDGLAADPGHLKAVVSALFLDASNTLNGPDKSGYFNQAEGQDLTGAGTVSGDDVNRHLRERRLGFKEPSADWANCHKVIRCIWPGQSIKTRPIDLENEYFHFAPAPACRKA